MKAFRGFIAAILAICIVFGSVGMSNIRSNAEGANKLTIYASELKTKTSDLYTYSAEDNSFFVKAPTGDVELIMDTELQLSSLTIDQKVTDSHKKTFIISGDKKLTVSGKIYTATNLVLKSGTNINAALLTGIQGIKIEPNAILSLDSSGVDNKTTSAMLSYVSVDTSGLVTIKSNYNAIFFGSAFNMRDGLLIVDAGDVAVRGSGNISLSGGDVFCHSSRTCLQALYGNVTIAGGSMECSVDNPSSLQSGFDWISDINGPIVCSGDGIIVQEPMYIKEPSGAYMKTIKMNQDDNDAKVLVDSSGNIPKKITFGNKNTDKKSADDAAAEAARKAAEEAARKAAEEAARKKTNKYSNEWVDGKWYNSDGVCDYNGELSWKCNATGWWVEDSLGWYPQNQWLKIDGKWYYFLDSGYMDYSEYRDGCWLGSDGAWVEEYYGGHWCSDSNGWWYEDSAGWYPVSQWIWIDGKCYYFEADGYLFED